MVSVAGRASSNAMRILYFSLVVVFLDQLTKLLVKGFSIPALGINHAGMDYAQSIPILGDWFNITFIENPNMAFSLDIAGKQFLSFFSIIASIVILIYLYKNREKPFVLRFSLAMILAGAVGNLIDRMFYGVFYGSSPLFEGNVVDFIDFDLFTVNFGGGSFRFWPIFNIADVAVSVGVILLIFASRHQVQQDAHAEDALAEAGGTGAAVSDAPQPETH